MFGIGFTELLIIGVVLLIAVGPNRLPKLLKTVFGLYKQLRSATRDLRTSSGIDELLQDEDLRDLRNLRNKKFYIPPAKLKKSGVPGSVSQEDDDEETPEKKFALTFAERARECPEEGVDLAEIYALEERPTEEEAAKIREDKDAARAGDEEARQAKLADAGLKEDEHGRAIPIEEKQNTTGDTTADNSEAETATHEPAGAEAEAVLDGG